MIKEKLTVLFEYKGRAYNCPINRDDIETMVTDWKAEDFCADVDKENFHMVIFDLYGNLKDGEPTTDNLEIYVSEYIGSKGYKTVAKIKNVRVLECD